jgi:hypothetical protein
MENLSILGDGYTPDAESGFQWRQKRCLRRAADRENPDRMEALSSIFGRQSHVTR